MMLLSLLTIVTDNWWDIRDLSNLSGAILDRIDAAGGPSWLIYVVSALLGALGIVSFIGAVAVINIWVERRVVGRMQSRLGPNRLGPFRPAPARRRRHQAHAEGSPAAQDCLRPHLHHGADHVHRARHRGDGRACRGDATCRWPASTSASSTSSACRRSARSPSSWPATAPTTSTRSSAQCASSPCSSATRSRSFSRCSASSSSPAP